MREAVIVSTARTPIGKAYRGAFNDTPGQELAAHAIARAVERAGIEGGLVEDVVLGCALQQGSTGGNVARQALLPGHAAARIRPAADAAGPELRARRLPGSVAIVTWRPPS